MLLQTYAWSHICMCSESVQVIWQDYEWVCLPPPFSVCQLPAVVESPWEPLRHMTWISMRFSCHWPLCPTLPLECIYLLIHALTHSLPLPHAEMPICMLLLDYNTIQVVIWFFHNSIRRTLCRNISACYCTVCSSIISAQQKSLKRLSIQNHSCSLPLLLQCRSFQQCNCISSSLKVNPRMFLVSLHKSALQYSTKPICCLIRKALQKVGSPKVTFLHFAFTYSFL